MKLEKTPEKTPEKIPNWFHATPAGREHLAQQNLSREAERQQVVKQLAEAKAAHDKKSAAISKKMADARTAVIAAQAAYEKAARAYRLCESECVGNVFGGEYAEGDLWRRLRALTPEVDEFLQELRKAYDRQYKPNLAWRTVRTRDGYDKEVTATTWGSIEAHKTALRRAIEEAEQLRFGPIEDIPLGIESIRAGIPPVSEEPDWKKAAEIAGVELSAVTG